MAKEFVDWKEYPDPTPVEIPVHMKRPPTLQEQIQMFVRTELSRRADEVGLETFEEADDFDVGDSDDLASPYEISEMADEVPAGEFRRLAEEAAKKQAAAVADGGTGVEPAPDSEAPEAS